MNSFTSDLHCYNTVGLTMGSFKRDLVKTLNTAGICMINVLNCGQIVTPDSGSVYNVDSWMGSVHLQLPGVLPATVDLEVYRRSISKDVVKLHLCQQPF